MNTARDANPSHSVWTTLKLLKDNVTVSAVVARSSSLTNGTAHEKRVGALRALISETLVASGFEAEYVDGLGWAGADYVVAEEFEQIYLR